MFILPDLAQIASKIILSQHSHTDIKNRMLKCKGEDTAKKIVELLRKILPYVSEGDQRRVKYRYEFVSEGYQGNIYSVFADDGSDVSLNAHIIQALYHQIGSMVLEKTVAEALFEFSTAHGHTGLTRLLIDKGVDLNLVDDQERTALHRAAEKNQKPLVNLLIGRGANTSLQDIYGLTPYDVAQANFHEQCAFMCGAPAPAQTLKQKKRTSISQQLIDAFEKGGKEGIKIIKRIEKKYKVEIATFLNSVGENLLYYYIVNTKDLDINSEFNQFVIKECNSLSVLEAREDPKPLISKVLKQIVVNQAIIISKCKGVWSPSLDLSSVDALKVLQKVYQIDLCSIRTKKGSTLLHVAANHNNNLVVEYLLRIGVDSYVVNAEGDTALNCAFRKRNKECVSAIKSYGPLLCFQEGHLSAKDKHLLTIALTEEDAELVIQLLSSGFPISPKDRYLLANCSVRKEIEEGLRKKITDLETFDTIAKEIGFVSQDPPEKHLPRIRNILKLIESYPI